MVGVARRTWASLTMLVARGIVDFGGHPWCASSAHQELKFFTINISEHTIAQPWRGYQFYWRGYLLLPKPWRGYLFLRKPWRALGRLPILPSLGKPWKGGAPQSRLRVS